MSADIRKIVFSGFMFWVAVAAIGLYLITPLREKLRFGIDLAGGTYITLEVQTEKAIEDELVDYMEGIRHYLKKTRVGTPTSAGVENQQIVFTFSSSDAVNAAAEKVNTTYAERTRGIKTAVEGTSLYVYFTDAKKEQIKRAAVAGNVSVLRTRFDSVEGVKIAEHGERSIVVELPDVHDSQQARSKIGKAAKLEFKLVERTGPSREDIIYEIGDELPKDKEILPDKKDDKNAYYLVSKYTEVTGASLKDAYPGLGGQSGTDPLVHFVFSTRGGEKFKRLTGRNYGRQLAVVLDGEVITAPKIQSTISTQGQITGIESPQEAKRVSLLLKSGAFSAPVSFEEERQIGSTLGDDSIYQGKISFLVGLGLVLLFSLYYYKLSGFLAFLALIYNMLLILVGMAWLKATLTLPGIAGLVLTIGMAIDASILIYERIKEELSAGSSVYAAVNSGFSNAMKVILDANITTFIAGIVLYKFGTGPIQGFAVTMMFGIFSTLIAGLFFLRSLFNFILNVFKIQKLSI